MFFTTNYRPLRVPCIPAVDSDHFLSNSQLSFTRIKPAVSMLHFSFNVRHSSRTAALLLDHVIEEETQIDATTLVDYLENIGLQIKKEAERRRKIGLAKKGKVPWNKGKKHTAETRALIINRTREALKDPKVRKRMFERQTHACSTDTRAKMVMGQKRAWQKRYKVINNKNKFYSSWGDCIAESAKKGLLDQQKLDWDSYEKMTSEIAFQQLHSAEEKENVKKMAKLAREGEKRERRATQRKEKEEEARRRREAKIKLRLEAKKAKEELQVSRKLKAKITKIRRRKTLSGHHRTKSEKEVATNHEPAIEKLDLESIQREKSRRDLSLADQIQAAKQRRSVNGGHDTITREVDLDMMMKRQKPQCLLSFADQILAAKKKRAESAMKEALNGQVVGEDVAMTSPQQSSTEKPNFELMRVEKVQSMSSFVDQIQAAKRKQAAESATKESVINGFQLRTMEDVATSSPQPFSIKGQDLDSIRREKVRGMLSFADQIQAAKQKRAEESAAKEILAHHLPIS